MQLTYETLAFRIEKDQLVVTLLKLFETKIPLSEVSDIGEYNLVDAHTIKFNYNKAELKFSYLLNKYFNQLKNKLTGNSVTYIHRNSDIPLIGNVAFGIVYRNSSIIEIKPITSCNLNCVYCSISEGLSSKNNDFVIEKDYLIEELEKLVDFVDEPVEIHIGVQGEPFLYADMTLLIEDLQKMDSVRTISIDTNGTLLNKKMIDRLAKNDKLQMNFSLDAVDSNIASQIAGVKSYKVKHVQEMIIYAAKKIKLIVAPVLIPGLNENQMDKIIEFVAGLPNVTLGIQNYLSYKTGRNAGKSLPWSKFYSLLEEWEKKHDIKLKLQKEDFGIRKTKDLEKPFETNDRVVAVLKCPGRFIGSSIAVADGRNISVSECKFVKDKKVKLEIVRSKHNIFIGKLAART